MCGITGFFSKKSNNNFEKEKIISKMTSVLFHRGPDSFGIWTDNENNIAFGHRRLSILDLSEAGHQPMISDNNRYILIFNGEIYNHLKLREIIKKESNKNIIWRGHSDTETILKSIENFGIEKTLKLILGMFAIAVWDKQNKTLTLARDRIGEKPLYYGWIKNDFVFGSELKALKEYPDFDNNISKEALEEYLKLNYIPSPHSIYENIYKLKPGNFIHIKYENILNKDLSLKKYWCFSEHHNEETKNPLLSESEYSNLIEESLKNSVSSQMISDVPLGAFLSGGIDSSLIVAMMQDLSDKKIKTFTIGFEDSKFDESPYARSVANHIGTDHNELIISKKNAFDLLPEINNIYDEPFADASQIPTFFLSKFAREKVKVSLSGDGGDELFGGYERYFDYPEIWDTISEIPYSLRKYIGKSIKFLPKALWDNLNDISKIILLNEKGINLLGDRFHTVGDRLQQINSYEEFCISHRTGWESANKVLIDRNKIKKPFQLNFHNVNFKSPISYLMYDDTLNFLPDDIICKVDRASMASSLETRMPFLDHRLVELSAKIPLNLKIRENQGKWILRKILNKYVPRELIDRPKAGFAIPLADWLRGPLNDWARSLIQDKKLEEDGIFQKEAINQVWKQHLSGKYEWSTKLWSILIFQSWLNK